MFEKISIRWILIMLLTITSIYFYDLKNEYLEDNKLKKELLLNNDSKIKDLNERISFLESDLNNEFTISVKYNDLLLRNLRNKKYSGTFKTYYTNGYLNTTGFLQNGKTRGSWTKYTIDGSLQEKFYVSYERVGAVCFDGSKSSATGRGACSWHGGVDYWLYDFVKIYTYPSYNSNRYIKLYE